MYCSSCGANVAQSLTYCNQCGAKLSRTKDETGKASEISPNILVCAMVITFIFGMAAVIMLTGAARGGDAIAVAVLALSFLLMLSLEGMFIWLLLRRRKAGRDESDANRLKEREAKELYAPPVRGLAEPVPSVTDQTTNQLEPIYADRKREQA